MCVFVGRFCTRDDVVQKALPRLESSLDSFHQWCHKKVEDFLTSWSLRPLLQVVQHNTTGNSKCSQLLAVNRFEKFKGLLKALLLLRCLFAKL